MIQGKFVVLLALAIFTLSKGVLSCDKGTHRFVGNFAQAISNTQFSFSIDSPDLGVIRKDWATVRFAPYGKLEIAARPIEQPVGRNSSEQHTRTPEASHRLHPDAVEKFQTCCTDRATHSGLKPFEIDTPS